MNYYSFIFSVICFISSNILAQKQDVGKGYIVDNEGERVAGFVELQNGEIEYEVKFRFKKTAKAKKYTTYKPKTVSAYGFEEIRKNNSNTDYIYMRHFIRYELDRPAKIFAPTTSFIERVVDGDLELYQFLYETPSDIKHPVTTRYIVMQDGKELYQIEREDFARLAKELFSDYDALVRLLGDSQFKFQNLPRLINDYNYWLVNKHDPKDYKLNPIIYNQ